jgi:hypothetical protein
MTFAKAGEKPDSDKARQKLALSLQRAINLMDMKSDEFVLQTI